MRITYLPTKRYLAGLLVVGALFVGLGATRADIVQPNGVIIPVGGALANYLNGSADNDNINEGINGIKDAAIQPQVFSPLCDFSGKYVAKGGGANFAIGWYNVDDARLSNNPPKYVPVGTDNDTNLNTPAANSDIQLLFPFASALPANRTLAAASIRMSPAYKNGLIGFVLVPNPKGTGNPNANQYHYTEYRFNLQCTKCATKGPYYSNLIYKSKMLANTFYLGFEDLDFADADGAAGSNGNDLDYEDFLFRFTGISCVGAGEACTIPANKGACQLGVKDCDGTGTLACKAINKPAAEKCDGVDNNCDGQVDENAPCPTGLICDRGRCTRNCDNEIPCPRGLACDSGRCIDADCVGKTCPTGQLCRDGACGDACAGIKCPSPSICSGGLCVDPCVGVTCAARQVCVNGACIPTCDCLPCGGTQSCQSSSGKCVAKGCETTTCASGEQCQGGTCLPACTGSVCPSGQACQVGMCIDDTGAPDMGTDPNGTPDGDDGVSGGSVATSGCTCNLAAGPRAANYMGLGTGMLLLGLALFRSRRRARN